MRDEVDCWKSLFSVRDVLEGLRYRWLQSYQREKPCNQEVQGAGCITHNTKHSEIMGRFSCCLL